MLRRVLFASALIALAAQASAAPFRVQGGPRQTPERPLDAKKIIQDIQSDYERALKDLERDNPSDEARQAQQRIADGIKKLLDQQNPKNQSPKSAANPPPPKSPVAQPRPAPKPMAQPMPVPQVSEAKKPMPEQAPARPETALEKIEAKPPPDAKPGSLNDLFGKSREAWPPMPWRQRPDLDAIAGERFSPRHAAILREYFRALAESKERETRDR